MSKHTPESILAMADAEAGPECCNEEYCRLSAIMAAAPDLFSALDRLTKWAEVMAEAQTCEHTGDHPIAIARAALIKAMTGESQ